MPLFTFFVVTVPALVGALFLAAAELGPPPPMTLGRETALSLATPNVPKPHSLPILTVNESRWVAPDMSSLNAMAEATLPAIEPPKKEPKAAAVHHNKKKVARVVPDRFGYQAQRNMYAEYGTRRDVW